MAEKELIRDLTPEQESLLDVYYKKGLAWGLDCSPSNRPVAEEAIKSLYKKSGHAEPKFFWVNSQHEALALYRKESGHPKALLPTPYSGQHEGSWVAWWKYYQEVLKAEVDPDAEDRGVIAQNTGWWYSFEGAVIAVERFEEIHLDENNNLHCEDSFAVKYRNEAGGEFFIHGHNVPAKVVMAPETLTPSEIQSESNAEVRRIMVERYGPGKYLVAIGAKLVDADGGIGVDGSAPRALYEDDKRQKWMVGTDGSTGRVYYMSVPNETKTCREGHQLISGLADETKCQFEC